MVAWLRFLTVQFMGYGRKTGTTLVRELALPYDLFGNGKTALRGGWGISYERNFGNVTFKRHTEPTSLRCHFYSAERCRWQPFLSRLTTQVLWEVRPAQRPFPKSACETWTHVSPLAYAHLWSAVLERQVTPNFMMAIELQRV